MHSDTTGPGAPKPNRMKVFWAKVRRMLRQMRRRFLLGMAYSSGSACVSLAVLWLQQHRR